MRIIKISLSVTLLLLSVSVFSQSILKSVQQSELTQIQKNVIKDYIPEDSNTTEVFSFETESLRNSNSFSFNYLNTRFNFIGSKKTEQNESQFTWSGKDVENEGEVNLFYLDEKLGGEFIHLGIIHDIQPIEKGIVLIHRSPERGVEYNDEVIPVDDFDNGAEIENGLLAGDGECFVRVLVAYSNQANVAGRDYHFHAQARINEMNTHFSNSDIDHEVELAGVLHLNWNQPTTAGDECTPSSLQCTALNQLKDNTTLQTERNRYDADIVIVVLSIGSGIAFREPGAGSAYATINWTRFNNSGDKTFSHELGHTYGCRHNTEEDNADADTHGYNAGNDNSNTANWRTILAYPSGCGCNRINNFSNPSESVGGVSTGPDPDVHDCAGKINDRASAVADFRKVKTNKTLHADNLNNTSDYLYIYGHSTVTSNVNFTVGNGAQAALRGKNSVSLNNGFTVNNGGQLRLYNGSCGNNIPGIHEAENVETRELAETSELGQRETELTVSPNPMTSEAIIEFYNQKEQPVSLFISDVEGKLIHSFLNEHILTEGKQSYRLTNDKNLQGMYICTLITPDKKFQKKFIVLN